MRSPTSVARIAGAFYVASILFSVLATSLRNGIVVSANAGTTVANLRASSTLFRAGILSDLLQVTCFLLAYLVLYALLRHADQLAASAMVVFAAIGVGVYSLNLLNLYTALSVATGSGYSSAGASRNTLVLAFANMQPNGYFISEMFFGLLLLPLGYLILKSEYLPRVLGCLVIVGGVGYIADLFARVLFAGYGNGFTPLVIPGAIGELSLAAWLLVMGVRRARSQEPPLVLHRASTNR